jgi:hypothetical protein
LATDFTDFTDKSEMATKEQAMRVRSSPRAAQVGMACSFVAISVLLVGVIGHRWQSLSASSSFPSA